MTPPTRPAKLELLNKKLRVRRPRQRANQRRTKHNSDDTTGKQRERERWGDRIRNFSILIWTAIWLYLSLGMVLVSFSAIQFQTQIADEARKDSGSNTVNQGTSGDFLLKVVTVAQIQLNRDHYEADLKSLPELMKQVDILTNSASKSSFDYGRIAEITKDLYPKLFSSSEPVPSNVVDAITQKCANAPGDAIKQQCSSFKDALSVSAPSNDVRDAALNNLRATRQRINEYEKSSLYSESADVDGYKRLAQFVFPWMPKDVLLPALPHPVLVMIVTLSMGALGSALFMLQLHLAGEGSVGGRMSLSWHLFRPLQGMAAALAVFLLVKAGQISVSHSGPGVEDADLNAFVLGFLGIVSGLLSDRAMDRITAAGVELLGTSVPRQTKAPSTTEQAREQLSKSSSYSEQEDGHVIETADGGELKRDQAERSD